MSDDSITFRDLVRVNVNRLGLSSIRDALPETAPPQGSGSLGPGAGASQHNTLSLVLAARSASSMPNPKSRVRDCSPTAAVDKASTIHGLGISSASAGYSSEFLLAPTVPLVSDGVVVPAAHVNIGGALRGQSADDQGDKDANRLL